MAGARARSQGLAVNTPLDYAHHTPPLRVFNGSDDSGGYSFDLYRSDYRCDSIARCVDLSMSLRGSNYGMDRIIFSRTGEYRTSYASTFFSRLFPAPDLRRRQ